MFKILKPFLGPVALFCLEAGSNMSPYHSEFVSGLLIGVGGFWIALVTIGNKALLQKFPRLIEWAPFLDPTGGITPPQQLSGKYINGHSFHIYEIAKESKILDKTFEDCDIFGPAVIHPAGAGQISDCSFEGSIDMTFIKTTQNRLVGIILAQNCIFKKCRFHNIAIIGNPESVDIWSNGVSGEHR